MNSWVLQGRHQLFKRNTDSVSMVLSSIIRFRFVLFMSVPTFKVTKFALLHLTTPDFSFLLSHFLPFLHCISVSMVLSSIIRFRFVLFMSVPTFKVTKFALLHLTTPDFSFLLSHFLPFLHCIFLGLPLIILL